MTVILYAVALLLLRGVSECSCYRIKRNTNCGNGRQQGQCVPLSDCREFPELLERSIITQNEENLIKSRISACNSSSSTVLLYCCFNPIITTTPIRTTESTTVKFQRIISAFTPTETTSSKPSIKKYASYVPKMCGIHTAQSATFGWTVLIGTGHFYRRCIGTLINDGFVLTAAHCVYEVKPNNVTLFFGSIKVEELPQCASENYRCQETRAEKFWIHDDYNDTTNTFNVALIKTTLDMRHYSMQFINPICLPLNTTDDDTDPAKRHILRPLIYGTSNELQEACGYSGAPIVVIDSFKLYHVVGVANHPVECDRKRVKRDATPAMEYVDWILSILTEGKEHMDPWKTENQTQQQGRDRYITP
ncbi:serine protease 7-like [Anopheles aquasalis]|uniref:serine protease 7-like n=1 Tax=Anopheles aquasalis TaxID=42839 RepID=UPI00215A5102|nr:serine protease 7-like [Anopheles aquasalis]